MKDSIYSLPLAEVPRFSFDRQVADVFDDMIRRSVPGYTEVLSIQANLIPRLIQEEHILIDLGCSTGNLFELLRNRLDLKKCRGVDPSEPMIEKARRRFANGGCPEFVQSRAQEADLTGAGVVVLNYVLQFLDEVDRVPLLERIYHALPVGGVLFLSEKVRHTHAFLSELEVSVHHDHKRAMGYSDLEIQQKRDAIEDYLRPDSLDLHLARLKNVGFSGVDVVFKWMNFCSFLAIKGGR